MTVVRFDPLLEAEGNFIDLASLKWTGANNLAQSVLSAAEAYFRKNPTERVFYARDPKRILDPKVFAKEAYRLFSPDENDPEMFADGPGPLGGVWLHDITAAGIEGFDDEVRKTPPNPKLEPVQGKTSAGWRITIAKPYKHYADASAAAQEQAAQRLAKEGYYPISPKVGYRWAGGPELRAKYYALGQKAKKAGKPFKIDPDASESVDPRRRLAEAQATSMDRMRRLAGIV